MNPEVCAAQIIRDHAKNDRAEVKWGEDLTLDQSAKIIEKIASFLRAEASNLLEITPNSTGIVERAQANLMARRERTKILKEPTMAKGPAWDILLDLYINESEGRLVSVTEAALAAECPATTGLRWVNALKQCGYVALHQDELDHRRRFVTLTEKGRVLTIQAIEAYG